MPRDLRDATQPRARPGHRTVRTWTSAPWCARPSCSRCRWRRCAPRTAVAGPGRVSGRGQRRRTVAEDDARRRSPLGDRQLRSNARLVGRWRLAYLATSARIRPRLRLRIGRRRPIRCGGRQSRRRVDLEPSGRPLRPAGIPLRCSARAWRPVTRPRTDSRAFARTTQGTRMAVPKKKTSKSKSRSRRASAWTLEAPAAQHLPALRGGQAAPRRVRQLRLVPRPPGHRRRLIPRSVTVQTDRCPSPSTPWAGTRRPARSSPAPSGPRDELGVPVVLVGRPDELGDTGGLEVIAGVRGHRHGRRSRLERAHDEGLLAGPGRRGGARRQGVGHGQRRQHRRHHGQRAAAHGADQGRGPPGHRHADPGARAARPTVLLDAGANAECQAEWLVQFAQMGAVFARDALRHRPSPGSACCRSARSPPRATRWSRRPTSCWPTARWAGSTGGTFIGNVEGRDIMIARRRRRRHRRLHRQRRAEDARGRHAAAGRRHARRVRHRRRRPRPPPRR